MKLPYDRNGLRFYLTLIGILAGKTTGMTVLASLPILLPGIALHFWAKGCLLQNAEVSQGGPYRYVRHPFYLANLLIDASIVIMSGWWVLAVFFPFWWFGIYIPTMRSEERYVESRYPGVYEAFRRRVPALFPWRRPVAKAGREFCWTNHNIAEGSEIPRMFRLLAYPLLFFIASEFRAEGFPFIYRGDHVDFVGLTSLITLYALERESMQHFKRQRLILPAFLRRSEFQFALILILFVLAGSIELLEIQIRTPMLLLGISLFLCSMCLFRYRHALVAYAAEGLLLAGTMVLCELPWLAAVPIIYYTALMLDTRLTQGKEDVAEAPLLPAPRSWAPVRCAAIMVFGTVLAVFKELMLD